MPHPRSQRPRPCLCRGDAWSTEQQKALEEALQKVPASVGQARWDRIAELVPGKTRGECVKRYKGIVQALKAKKAAVASDAAHADPQPIS